MRRETKFNYGFFLAGIGVTYLMDRSLGLTYGLITAIVFAITGLALLASGHLHQEGGEPLAKSPWARAGIYVFISGLLGLGIIGIGWAFHRAPPKEAQPAMESKPPTAEELTASCSLPKDYSPCEIKCSVDNPHESPMTNVSIGFNGIYPYQTRLAAGTETHIRIKKQDTLPLPMSDGYIDRSLQAFSVELPLIPPKTTLSFSLWTTDVENQRACTYIRTTIRSEQRRKLDQLVKMNPHKGLDADAMSSLQAKKTSLFVPGYFMSSEGRQKVNFITNQEEETARSFDPIYEKESKSIGQLECLIPIFAAERTDGARQYFDIAPPMMTWLFNRESMKTTRLPDGKTKIETDPHPPEKYACTEAH